MLTTLDISGFGFSGKSAFIDYLSDYQNVKSLNNEIEFDLFRIKNGLFDLRKSVCGEPWSMIRSAEALYAFEKVLKNICGGRGLRRLLTPGSNLSLSFPKLEQCGLEFIHALTKYQIDTDWPFRDFNEAPTRIFLRKVARKIDKPFKDTVCISRMSYEEFDHLCVKFLELVFHDILNENHNILILNNAFESSDPGKFLQMVPNGKSIVVDRDPRDIYISAQKAPKSNPGRSMVLGRSVHEFIARQKLERIHRSTTKICEKVVRLNFEDLILSKNDTHLTLANFLGSDMLKKTGKSYNPGMSARNVEMWNKPENAKYLDAIRCIEEHLIEMRTDA